MQLNDLLQSRVRTFIYPEWQKELAGFVKIHALRRTWSQWTLH